MPGGRSAAAHGRQRGMVFPSVAVIQKLDGQAVLRPVQGTRRPSATRNASGPSLQTGSCTSTCGSFGVGEFGHRHPGLAAGQAHPGQHDELDGQEDDGDENEAQGEGQGVAERSRSSGPPFCSAPVHLAYA